jgi:hypothetical protein
MRLAVGTIACLGLLALTPVFADPPAQPQASPSTSAPSTSAPSAPATAPTDQAAAAAADAAKAAEVSAKEKHFLSEGYKPEMHGGEKMFCRRQGDLGSRLSSHKICGTVDQLDAAERETQADVEQAQRQQSVGAH